MIKLSSKFKGAILISASLLMMNCSKEISREIQSAKTTEERALENLLAYKKSPHQVLMGYYCAWKDAANHDSPDNPKMTDLPDSVDIVSVFASGDETDKFYTKLKEKYVPALHKMGTKVIWTQGRHCWRGKVQSQYDQAGIYLLSRIL